jgi:hypothetical protein
MKRLLAALIFVLFAALPALAELPAVKAGIKGKTPALTTPQQKLKQLPRTAIVPQTGQDGGSQPQTEETTPQPGAAIEFLGFEVGPQAPPSSCMLKWTIRYRNTGSAPTGNLLFRHVHRKAAGVNESEPYEDVLDPVAAGATSGAVGLVPSRAYEEVFIELRDGGNVLASAVYALPASVAPSADNLAIGDPVVSSGSISFDIRNTGNSDVSEFNYVVHGVVDPASPVRETLSAGSVQCLPAGGTQNARVDIPLNPYPAYNIILYTDSVARPLSERTAIPN